MTRPIRITAPSAKAGVVIAWLIATALLVFGLAQARLEPAAEAAALVSLSALVVFAARTFRAPEDGNTQRPLWQLTSDRVSSTALALVFAGSSAVGLVAETPGSAASPVVHLILSVGYAWSALRLGATSKPNPDQR
jgi:hypothetical protein